MIKICDLTKEFRVYKRHRGMLKQLIGLAKENIDYETIESLKNINLEIPKGEVHGIIGMNGAGKSTLLKILTRVLDPTRGTITLDGRVAALLELGTGFHHELTGRENVFLNGTILGFTRAEVEKKLSSIIEFAELGDFFDRPVRIYSSGMYVRLAFAFAVSVDPDILIIDEALSVGDVYFQQKCLKKIQSFKERGTTILFVSHDLGAVRALCDRVTLLSKGSMVFTGSPLQALDLYNALLAEHRSSEKFNEHVSAASQISPEKSYQSGSKAMEILSVDILSTSGEKVEALVTGDPVSMIIRARVNRGPLENPTCGILIRDRLGYDVFGTNTFGMRVHSGKLSEGQILEYHFDAKLNLGPGDYTLTIALHSDRSHVDENYHWLERAKIFTVLPAMDFEFIGIARLEPSCRINLIN